jgi:hypothetical protein
MSSPALRGGASLVKRECSMSPPTLMLGRRPAVRGRVPSNAAPSAMRSRVPLRARARSWCRPAAASLIAGPKGSTRLVRTRWEHVARGALVVPLRSNRKRSAPEIGRFVFPQLRQCPPALSQCRANAEAGGRTWPPLRARSSRHSRSRPPKVPAFVAFRSSASVNVIGSRTLSLFSS